MSGSSGIDSVVFKFWLQVVGMLHHHDSSPQSTDRTDGVSVVSGE